MNSQNKIRNEKLKTPLPTPHSLSPALCSLLFALCSLLFVSCADMFQPKLTKTNTAVPGSLDDMFRKIEDITKLDPPGQLYAAPFYSRSEIRLSWEPVRHAAFYVLERAVSVPIEKDGQLEWEEPVEYEPLASFIYDRFYTDVVLKNPSLTSPEYRYRFYYRVSAFNPAQNIEESDASEPVFAMLFRAPAGVKATGGTFFDRVRVTWEPATGAAAYEIWRSNTKKGAASLLGTVTGNQLYYEDNLAAKEQGEDFYYILTAKTGDGNVSLQTEPQYGYAKVDGAPDAPEIRRSEGYGRGNSTTQLKIEWDPVGDPADAVRYAVYRYSSVDSSLTRITLSTNITGAEWLDNNPLDTGVYYYYKVQAIGKDKDDNEVKSAFSGKEIEDCETEEEYLDALAESFLLSPPVTVVAEKDKDSGEITIKWLPPSVGSPAEKAAYIYSVYDDARIDGAFNGAPVNKDSTPGEDGYISVKIPSGKGPFFKVTTFHGTTESVPSIVVTPSPAPAIIQGVSKRAFISPEAQANKNGVYPVKVSWKKPAEENENPAFYQVERANSPDGPFSRIPEVPPLNADGTGFPGFVLDDGVYSYIDSSDMRVGKMYYYRIKSLNLLGAGSFYSDVKDDQGKVMDIAYGYGALTPEQFMIEYDKTRSSSHKKLTLMHKPGSTEKLGAETKNGTISGTLSYDGKISGLGARIIMEYKNYADKYIEDDPEKGPYFIFNGNTNTSANMSSNGTMDGTVTVTGMYPGTVKYDRIEIRGGAAGGGYYEVTPQGYPGGNVPYNLRGLSP